VCCQDNRLTLAAIGGLASGVAVAVYLTGLLHSVVARLWTVDDVAVRSLAVVRASGDIGDADARFFNARDLRRLRLYLPDAVWIRPIYAAQQVLTACGRSDFVMLLGIDSGVETPFGVEGRQRARLALERRSRNDPRHCCVQWTGRARRVSATARDERDGRTASADRRWRGK